MLGIKLVLYGLILAVSSFIGITIAQKYNNRVKNLREMKKALNHFKTKIKFTYEPIPEILEEMIESVTGESKQIFISALEKMENKNAGEAWNEAIEASNVMLEQEDKDILKNLGKLLGKTDIEGQLSEIELTSSFLDSQIKKAEQERERNGKLYKTLGVITGIGIVIVLLVRAGREDQAMMTTLAGLIIVLTLVIKEISTLFSTVRTIFNL